MSTGPVSGQSLRVGRSIAHGLPEWMPVLVASNERPSAEKATGERPAPVFSAPVRVN